MAGPIQPKLPTLKDLAREAGVSLTTASYAINGTGSVGQGTRDHVLKVAERIGFRLNLTAKTMKSGRSGILAVIVPDLSNPFFGALVQALFREARAAGYRAYMTNTEGADALEADALAMAVGLRVDGLVWFPIRDRDTSGGILAATPTVLLDRCIPGYDAVTVDYHDAGRQAAEHLLAHGHRRIGIVSGPMDVASMRDRCSGVREVVVARAALAFELENAFSLDLEADVGTALTSGRATAIFAGADVIAIGLLRHARAAGIAVPGNVSIMGFDDIELASLVSPALSTMDIPIDRIANRALSILTDTITKSRAGHVIELVPSKVMNRASIAMAAAS